ncbi:MAG: bifunctional phosphopantothenoylcysteine decarboxylase/phosphopantothenate--cysteine ligase CoaBC [Solirubrobacteraceae bacterium]
MARLLLGVSGGISAYKALETARLAIKAGHSVRVVQTEASKRFVGPPSFEAITGAPVLTGEFEPDPIRGAFPGDEAPERSPISHLALVQRADAYLIAPASANTIAKLAHGLADNLLTAAALAARCPVLVAPAMNNHMYLHPATQANLELLTARGVTVIAPDEGELASHGEHGIGRLPDPVRLLAAVESALAGGSHALLGVRVLVTAGGTREPIDSVRFIGNSSSGRMGFALARQAARRGAEVTLLAANTRPSAPAAVRVVEVQTAAQLKAACEREFDGCDVLLMAAAVADFRPREPADHKLKKDLGPPTIELEPTADILSGLADRRRPGQLLVGFAAEHGERAVEYGAEKLERKRLDAVVVNDISQPGIGFDAADNEVTIVLAGGRRLRVSKASKEEVAGVILDEVESLLAGKETDDRAIRAHADRATRV